MTNTHGRQWAVVVVGAVAMAGCAALFPQVVPEAQGEFKPTGSIQMKSYGASFDGARVISPSITLSRRTDGSWGGRFALAGSGDPQAIDVSVTPTSARGVDFVMVREEPKPGVTVISGKFKNSAFRFELSSEAVNVHTTRVGADMSGRVVQADGSVAYGNLVLTGDATKLDELAWPQLGFALVAAFY